MKRILIIATLIIMSLQTMAQGLRGYGVPNWISIAGKVGFGTSLIFSEQIKDNGNINQVYFSPALSIGGRLGVVFKDRIGVSVEYLSSDYQHKYEFKSISDAKLKSNLRIKCGDLLALLRYTGEYGFYAELGPKFSMVNNIKFTKDGQPNLDMTNCFKGTYNSIVFGFGFSPYNGDRIIVTLGLRAAYCGSNIVKKVDGFGETNFGKYLNMEMKPFSAQAMIDINYHFARFGKATCGAGRVIFFK